MHPKKMLFSTQNITCEVAYIWLLSNRLRLNNDSAGSHIKEEGKLIHIQNSCLVAQLNSSVRLPLLDLEGCFRVLFIDFDM